MHRVCVWGKVMPLDAYFNREELNLNEDTLLKKMAKISGVLETQYLELWKKTKPKIKPSEITGFSFNGDSVYPVLKNPFLYNVSKEQKINKPRLEVRGLFCWVKRSNF